MIDVRPYAPEHYPELVKLYRNKHAYGGNFDAARDNNDRLLATSKLGNLFVALQGETVVGSIMILDNPHSFWLLRFVVDPELANMQDIASALFTKACEVARERNHTTVIVYTDNDDEILNQRYHDLGCHQADIYRCYWKETTV